MNSVIVRSLCILLLSALSFSAFAQNGISLRANTPINSNCNGYVEYKPAGYDVPANGSQKYPLMIFLGGIGHTGSGSIGDLGRFFSDSSGSYYPQDWMRDGSFPSTFTVGANTFSFLFIAPQWLTPLWMRDPYPSEINSVIDYAIQHYRVDTTRIYLTGVSSGGGHLWEYLSASSAYANRIAAAVPFCGVSYPSEPKASIIRNAHVAVWAFHNQFDAVPVTFSQDYINFINYPTPAVPQAKGTYPAVGGHDCWYLPYKRDYTENGLTIYDWMLQFQKIRSKAFAGDDKILTLPSNSTALSGSGTGPNGTASSYNWQQVSGPAAGTINNASSANANAINLAQGEYVFRLTITDNVGGTATDDINVSVKSITRIQAESFTAMNGVSTGSTTDEGGGTYVGSIDQGDWMDYTVTVPTAGTYRARFRASSNNYNSEFVVKNTGGTVLATVDPYNTGNWDTYVTYTRNLNLPAGTQTLRIQSTTPNQFNLNWFEIETTAPSGILPVNFVLFNANCTNGSVKLMWNTAGEINTRNFGVEKSNDGTTWTSLSLVTARGQSNAENSYSFNDLTSGSNSFYRIVAYDLDGRKTISPVLRSSCFGKQNLSLYPVPVLDQAMLAISSEQATRLQLMLVDSKGSVVLKKESTLPQGNSQLTLDLSPLPSGVYTLRAQWGNETRSLQLVKQ